MGKLSRRDVLDIVRRLRRGRISVYRLARLYGVSPRWIREIRRRSRPGQFLPGFRRRGRPPLQRSPHEADLVLAAERQHHLHPVALERVLDRHYGVHIPHNRIWRVLKEAGLVVDTPSKQERRAYVKWQRRHSNSLWQMDYSQLGPADWLLLILDDASRLLVGYARAKNATAELVWETFLAAGERWGFPRQVLSDHGTQFTKEPYDAVGFFDRKLRWLRRTRGARVQHIMGRKGHPQTGGKIERAFGTIKSKLRARWPDGELQFESLDEVIRWYNEEKPHLSLRFEEAETPLRAFVRKMRPKERRPFLRRHPEVRK